MEAAASGRLGKVAKKRALFYQNVLKKGQRTAARGRGKTVAAQFGFDGMVGRPTRFLVGEGNRPERVRITPVGTPLGGIINQLRAGAGLGQVRRGRERER